MIEIDLQLASESSDLPGFEQVRCWVDAVLSGRCNDAELVVRIVDAGEGAALNLQYRGKPGPTNVLSFPFDAPPGVASDLLGDVVICAPVVEAEAAAQGKPLGAHWAHMVVHGILHLLGYDHLEEAEAAQMEAEEVAVLEQLGMANPYEEVLTQ